MKDRVDAINLKLVEGLSTNDPDLVYSAVHKDKHLEYINALQERQETLTGDPSSTSHYQQHHEGDHHLQNIME